MQKNEDEMVDNDNVDPVDTWREMEKLYAVGKVEPFVCAPDLCQ
jgi:hypothetical protein